MLTRRKFLVGAGVVGLGFAGYARYWESEALRVTRHDVPLSPGRSRGSIRLLHLSDLHASRAVSLEFIQRAIDLGLRLKPDLICVTGDFVTHRFAELERYARILKRLPDAAPTYASLGNHDGGAWAGPRGGYESTREVRGLLAASGISLLHNTACSVTLAGRTWRLVGLGDFWAEELDAKSAFAAAPVQERVPTILLSHNPDTKDEVESFAWDLMLCGHTHGGQLRLPLLGTPFAPVRDKTFVEGLHRWKDRWVHITHGVGNLLGFRFNCRPEVSVLTLA